MEIEARFFKRFSKRRYICGGQRVENVLVDIKIKHEMNTIAFISEILIAVFWQDIGFPQQHGLAVPPLQKAPHFAQVFESDLAIWLSGFLSLEYEWYRIHAEAFNAEFDPVAHDLSDLRAYLRIVDI